MLFFSGDSEVGVYNPWSMCNSYTFHHRPHSLVPKAGARQRWLRPTGCPRPCPSASSSQSEDAPSRYQGDVDTSGHLSSRAVSPRDSPPYSRYPTPGRTQKSKGAAPPHCRCQPGPALLSFHSTTYPPPILTPRIAALHSLTLSFRIQPP